MLIVFIVILLSGVGLYILLKPPVELIEQPAENEELYAEVIVSNVHLPEYAAYSDRTQTNNSAKKE